MWPLAPSIYAECFMLNATVYQLHFSGSTLTPMAMFAPLGLFKEVPCPQGPDCGLLTCIFSHNTPRSASTSQPASQNAHVPSNDTDMDLPRPPAAKRIKLETASKSQPEKMRQSSIRNTANGHEKARPSTETGTSTRTKQDAVKLHSTSRAVSPPASRVETKAKPTKPKEGNLAGHERRRNAPKESLNPRMIPKAPATHAVRSSILTKLHAAMSALNCKVANDKNVERYLVLSSNELVTMALDEEEKAAKENANIYANVIKLRIVKLSKMKKEDWIEEVKVHLNSRYYKEKPAQASQENKPKPFTTSLSVEEEMAIVEKLITPLKGLEDFGYVTRAPSEEEIESAKKGVAESRGWEKCDRCGGRFQVFPGRREDGALTSGGPCTYHPGKAVYPPRKPTDHLTGPRDAIYLCCNETVGTTAGCTKAETHVFKVSETKRLASVLQFKETPVQSDKGTRQPVCFDCEMGYTTLGLEMIRLTAVSWPEGKELLDVLVKPMGEVLDLNSRYSGIFPEHYANAIPYGTGDASGTTTASGDRDKTGDDDTTVPKILQVVESPAAARELLFCLLQPDTPLIGHAIDNDLNACRVIHSTIIDTVLLYPHPRGLPNRMGLKALSRKYLDREIQTGGARGHDSKEDSIATGDLVRVKAAETWKTLKAKGWLIRDGKLVPPPGYRGDESDSAAARSLGPGAGRKRK
ncbi:RNA exonuclease 3 [Monascus purpureus]|uniref:RNA exonuclease 3 n=1 Tax=Monascus purpureus TaxID=5098 RepID=A0A507R3M9_MONPU|nr:RNA exonuclease 3 [Monascus purpureus]BDD56287.1 RNA exonuclease 3 [Monascus purpureus]